MTEFAAADMVVSEPPSALNDAGTRLANWIIAAVGDIPYSTMTSGQVIDALRTNRHVYEGNEGCGTYYKGDNTPAAPGIDLEQFRELQQQLVSEAGIAEINQLEADSVGFTELAKRAGLRKKILFDIAARLGALIDASTKGGSDALLREVRKELEADGVRASIGSMSPMESLHGRIAAHLERQQATSAKDGSYAEPMFYIQDTRSFVGNCPVWWAHNGAGYVTRIDEAGRFTEQEAIAQYRTRDTDVPWPCAEVDKLGRITVDVQHMRPRRERLAELQATSAEVVS